ncbi:hypothetical protein D3C71_1552950 [compost metagenome]
MSMMDIRKVRMGVPNRCMFMNMTMCTSAAPLKRMFVLVMLVVNVAMPVYQRHMLMFMCVAFGKVKPYTNPHQESSCPE